MNNMEGNKKRILILELPEEPYHCAESVYKSLIERLTQWELKNYYHMENQLKYMEISSKLSIDHLGTLLMRLLD